MRYRLVVSRKRLAKNSLVLHTKYVKLRRPEELYSITNRFLRQDVFSFFVLEGEERSFHIWQVHQLLNRCGTAASILQPVIVISASISSSLENQLRSLEQTP